MKKIMDYVRDENNLIIYKEKMITMVWIITLILVFAVLYFPSSREKFVHATNRRPYLMGLIELALLGTMGDLLGTKIVKGKWEVLGIKLHQRILVWGFIGILFTIAFPIYSYGVDGLLKEGYLPGANSRLWTSFWKSFLMNSLFAFPMMTLNRFLDKLVDKNKLFSNWPVIETFKEMDWERMFKVVAPTCIWFWMPVNTFTFLLPSEFRVLSGALLAVTLGFILGMAKKLG